MNRDLFNNPIIIKSPERMAQPIHFTGLKFGTISPTDIDLIFEINDKIRIGCELKYLDTKLPNGQRLCYKRLCDDFKTAGKIGYWVVARHEVHDVKEPIIAAVSIVREFYYDGKWTNPTNEITFLEFCTKVLNEEI